MGTSLVGKNIGSYRICGRLGSGGVGQVWRAVDTVLGRTVAVKALRPELIGHSQVADRFRAEAQILARLNHPNIATLHALVEEDGELFMVLEHVEGQTFSQVLRMQGGLPIERAFELFHPALDGLEFAHEAGVVHRDIKPSNLMVDGRGLVKVMDFGIARCGGSERVTRTGHLVGTPEYMSPEQIRGQDATVRSDVYALAILLYALLAGRPPFLREGEFDVMRAQVETPPPRPSEFSAGIPAAIENVILQALAKDPDDRFASVNELRNALVAAGAPEHTGGSLPAWAGEPGPPTQADPDALTESHPVSQTVSQTDVETVVESETAHDATTIRRAPPGPRVSRWQHAAVVVLALGLSLGANALHVSGDTTALESVPALVAPDPAPVETSVAVDEATATDPVPAEPKTRPPLAQRRPARDAPPALEETDWVIRR